MKVILSRPALAELIGKIQNIVPTKPVNPILANVLIEAEGETLIVSATDLTVSIRSQMDAHLLEPGAITLPARRFFQLVRELTLSEIELRTEGEDIATIQAGDSEFRLHGLPQAEFPSFPDLTQSEHFEIKVTTFKEMLAKTVFAAARDDSRHVLNGVLMQIENGKVIFTGTDGKRLAKVYNSIEGGSEELHSYLIPLKAVEEIIRSLEGEETAKISLMKDKIGIECGSTILITKLLSGDYPDVDRVFPKIENATSLTIHREELMALLKQVALFTSDRSTSVHFTLIPGELILTAKDSEIGNGKVSMPVDYAGEPLEIAFNPFYFHDILRHCHDETVNFALTSTHFPGLITDSSTANFIIMPMRLSPI